MAVINITGLDKAELLQKLYLNALPLGLGHLQYSPTDSLSTAEARALASRGYIDYCRGRCMKVNLSGNEFETRLYNRDNGEDAAERIVDAMKRIRDAAPDHKADNRFKGPSP